MIAECSYINLPAKSTSEDPEELFVTKVRKNVDQVVNFVSGIKKSISFKLCITCRDNQHEQHQSEWARLQFLHSSKLSFSPPPKLRILV